MRSSLGLLTSRPTGYEGRARADCYERDVGEMLRSAPTSGPTASMSRAPALALAVRSIGFRTPLWRWPTRRISDLPVVGGLGEVEGYLSASSRPPSTPNGCWPASSVRRVAAAVLRQVDGHDGGRRSPRFLVTRGGQFYHYEVAAGQLFFKHFGEAVVQRPCNADVELGDPLIHEGAVRRRRGAWPQVFGADRTYFVLNGIEHVEQGRHRRVAQARRPGAVRPQ